MLVEATSQIASRITGAIRDAAKATGTSFDYLLKTALRESNLNPTAKASTSSATGLFQFIDQTWLGTLKRDGAALGYKDYADAVVQSASGRFVVPDPAQRQAVMNLRNDPAAASAMAGAFTERNSAMLQNRLGREPSDGELYIAHFLGPSGAVRLIAAAEANPAAKAANLFPQAARANRSIFYDRAGHARSLSQVYASLVSRHDSTKTPTAIAAVTPTSQMAQSHAVSAAARTQAITVTAAAAQPIAAYADDRPVFHGLFRSQGGREPVSSVVNEMWGADRLPQRAGKAKVAKAAQVQAPAQVPAQKQVQASVTAPAAEQGAAPMRLFEFLRPEVRAKIGA